MDYRAIIALRRGSSLRLSPILTSERSMPGSPVHGKTQAEREARTCMLLSVTDTSFNI